jgi:hypothetical protein
VVDKVVQTLIVPQVGMVFESEEKAVAMYNILLGSLLERVTQIYEEIRLYLINI